MSRFIFKILSRNGSRVESPTADTTGTTARVRELIQKHLQDAPMQFLRPILANQKDWKPRKKNVFFFEEDVGYITWKEPVEGFG